MCLRRQAFGLFPGLLRLDSPRVDVRVIVHRPDRDLRWFATGDRWNTKAPRAGRVAGDG